MDCVRGHSFNDKSYQVTNARDPKFSYLVANILPSCRDFVACIVTIPNGSRGAIVYVFAGGAPARKRGEAPAFVVVGGEAPFSAGKTQEKSP